ncbi:MAG: 3-deoxy-D-manno-octulosonic acid transferase [Acidobacteriota bacterium]
MTGSRSQLMLFLYSLCFTLGFIVALPYFLFQAIAHRKYTRGLFQRLGFLPEYIRQMKTGCIWIHTVSVGEFLALQPLISGLRRDYPDRHLAVSTTTLTGQVVASQRLAGAASVFYFPFDWKFAVRRSLDQVRPAAVLIAETEIWPNFLAECHRRQIPVFLINGRISDKSFRRYRRIRWLVKPALESFHSLLMQNAADLERIRELGSPSERSHVLGNLKYDIASPATDNGRALYFRELFGLAPGTFTVVAGSTMKGEEPLVGDALRLFKKVCPSAILILAPRHAERFDEAATLLASQSWRFIRRSALEKNGTIVAGQDYEILLLDSLGELAQVYALADVVFVGGSLVPTGGHNIIEPALYRKPILFGPHMDNFREMASVFATSGAAWMVRDAGELAIRLAELYRQPETRLRMGESGFQILEANRGATQRTLDHLKVIFGRA